MTDQPATHIAVPLELFKQLRGFLMNTPQMGVVVYPLVSGLDKCPPLSIQPHAVPGDEVDGRKG